MNSDIIVKKLFVKFAIPISKFINDVYQNNAEISKEKVGFNNENNNSKELSRNLRKTSINHNKVNKDSIISLNSNKFDVANTMKNENTLKNDSQFIKKRFNINDNENNFGGVNGNVHKNNYMPNYNNNKFHFNLNTPCYFPNYQNVYNNNNVNNYQYDQYYNNNYGNYMNNNNYNNSNFQQNCFMQNRYNNVTNNYNNQYCPKFNSFNDKNGKKSKNLCNWQAFMTNSTPLIFDTDDLSLKSFFGFYDKISVLGLDCVLKKKGKNILSNYLPTLSSMYIELTNSSSDQVNNSFSSMNSRKTDLNSETLTKSGFRNQGIHNIPLSTSNFETSTYQSNSTEGSLFSAVEEENLYEKLKKIDNVSLVVDFTEDQILYNRVVMKEKIDVLFKKYPELEFANLGDITENSYFSILWTPFKSSNFFQNNTSFLVYYKFRNKQFTHSVKFLPVIGLISRLLDEEFWFANILLESLIMNEVIFAKLTEDFIRNRYHYNHYFESLQKLFVVNKLDSTDYNILIK